ARGRIRAREHDRLHSRRRALGNGRGGARAVGRCAGTHDRVRGRPRARTLSRRLAAEPDQRRAARRLSHRRRRRARQADRRRRPARGVRGAAEGVRGAREAPAERDQPGHLAAVPGPLREPPELSADGRHPADACGVGEPEERVFLQVDKRRLGPQLDVYAYAWDEDGRHIAYGANEGTPERPWRFYVDGQPQTDAFAAVWR